MCDYSMASIGWGSESSKVNGSSLRCLREYSQIFAGVTIIWRLDCGWRNHFQSGSLTWLTNWFLFPWPPHKAAWASSWHDGWLPPREQGGFCGLDSEVLFILFMQFSHIVKAVFLSVVMYGCESWTIQKAERWGTDAFELWCWRRLLRVPWTARRSN